MKAKTRIISLITAFMCTHMFFLGNLFFDIENTFAVTEPIEKEIEYTGPSINAFNLGNDGVSLRMNLYNVWGQVTTDIDNTGDFHEKISVTFTVEGLGTDSANIAEDGTETPFEAFLMGAVGTDSYWGPTANDNTVENKSVAIEGDGTYTAEFLLNDPAETILCLILSTNINVYQYSENGKPSETGISFTIDRITTMTEENEAEPDDSEETIGTASIIGAIGATSVWGADEVTDGSKTANINGDAQYEVVWKVTDDGTDKIEFLAVQIPGLSSDKYADLDISIDAVYVDGKKVSDYKTSENAINLAYTEGGAACTRIHLIDGWTGTGVADLPADTSITESLKVIFTVSGTGKTGETNISDVKVYSDYDIDDFKEQWYYSDDEVFYKDGIKVFDLDADVTDDAMVTFSISPKDIYNGVDIYYNIPFKVIYAGETIDSEIPVKIWMKSDLNFDNTVDEQDAMIMRKYLDSKIELTEFQKFLADTNNDGIIDNEDFSIYENIILTYNDELFYSECLDRIKIVGCCESLTEVEIPESINDLPVTSIEANAFSECSTMQKITIPDSVETIGNYAFYDCCFLKTVTLPESVVSIGEGAFNKCYLLDKIEVLNSNCRIYDSESTIYDAATIYGYDISTAHVYSVKYSRKFVNLDEEFPVTTTAVTTSVMTTTTTIATTVSTVSDTAPLTTANENTTTTTLPVTTTVLATSDTVPLTTTTKEITTEIQTNTTFTSTTTPITTTIPDTTTEIIVKGDISGNGKIDLYDAIEICKKIMGMRTFTEEENKISDFNGDGVVDLYDAIEIAKKLLPK